MSNRQALNAHEVKDIFGYIIDNNVKLSKEGKKPVSVSLTGEAGMGKTSVIEQLAKEKGQDFIKLNLSQISIEDFIGYPLNEYKMCKKDDCIWVSEKSIPAYTELGFMYANESRMSYSVPKWIAEKSQPLVLCLDDYSRGSLGMLQAAMELCDRGEYISWSLPKGSTVILTSNPDDGEYLVTTEDAAQKTRYLNYDMKLDVDLWAEWAEKYGVDGRCINFMLKNPEIVTGTKDYDEKGSKLKKANVRLWTKFFDTISGIPNFESQLGRIMLIGGSSMPEEHMLLFSQFVNGKLDRLLTPEQMLNEPEKKILKELKEIVGEGNKRRNDLSSILSKRLMNYCAANEKDLTKDQVERFAIILESNIFAKDIIQLIARKIIGIQKLKSIITRPGITQYYKN